MIPDDLSLIPARSAQSTCPGIVRCSYAGRDRSAYQPVVNLSVGDSRKIGRSVRIGDGSPLLPGSAASIAIAPTEPVRRRNASASLQDIPSRQPGRLLIRVRDIRL